MWQMHQKNMPIMLQIPTFHKNLKFECFLNFKQGNDLFCPRCSILSLLPLMICLAPKQYTYGRKMGKISIHCICQYTVWDTISVIFCFDQNASHMPMHNPILN